MPQPRRVQRVATRVKVISPKLVEAGLPKSDKSSSTGMREQTKKKKNALADSKPF